MSLFRLEMLSDQAFRHAIQAELEAAMDAELAKPEGEMNLALLEEFSDALLLLSGCEQADGSLTADTVSAFRRKHRFATLRKTLGSTAAVAAIAALCYAAMTAKAPQPVPIEPSTVITETTTAPAEPTTAPPEESTTVTVTEPTTAAPQETTTAAPTRQETTTTAPSTTADEAAASPYRAVKGADAPDFPNADEYGNPEDDSDYYYYGGRNGEYGGMDSLPHSEQLVLRFNDAFQAQYAIGEAFNPDGIAVTVKDEMRSYAVPLSQCTLSGFSSDTAGVKIITVRYQRYQASFMVEVIEV